MCGYRERTNILVLFALTTAQSLPIYNGFSVKFSPLLNKEEIRPKTFGALFAKIPQEPRAAQEALQRKLLSKVDVLGAGCTNQVAKILYQTPFAQNNSINSTLTESNYINIPIIQQQVEEYKILIAAAPPDVKINAFDDRPLVVYIVFPNDAFTDNVIMPKIYFVHEAKGHIDIHKKKLDPMILVDHKRKVTNLKSNEISKFVKFRNKLINHYRSVNK
ncbi:unnamed protein product [Pieris macdunnoughi]|uniref:Uncharacterized protein n=1 Tax=Pieris macdunnoughi TaxID=345717 RepID=A0A821L7H7_9NEOP|nr:unnamed protein product [Pieris macdunnoughi]